MLRTLNEILVDGIKEEDWTYTKPEYAPHDGCKVGMPTEFTPDGTTRLGVKTCYILTARFRDGRTSAHADVMYLSDGRFHWYDNLWDDDDVVDQELSDEWFMEPIAWIPYRNVVDATSDLPAAPCKEDAVPTPPMLEQSRSTKYRCPKCGASTIASEVFSESHLHCYRCGEEMVIDEQGE